VGTTRTFATTKGLRDQNESDSADARFSSLAPYNRLANRRTDGIAGDPPAVAGFARRRLHCCVRVPCRCRLLVGGWLVNRGGTWAALSVVVTAP